MYKMCRMGVYIMLWHKVDLFFLLNAVASLINVAAVLYRLVKIWQDIDSL